MKKLLFTALAVVAFSGVAMANNLEVEKAVVFNDPCASKAADYTDSQDPNGTNSPEKNNENYRAYYQGCYDEQQTPRITEA